MTNDVFNGLIVGMESVVKYNPDYAYFGLLGDPFDKKQHPNQQGGLDKYVHVINFMSGEWCLKKLYQNKKGLHFKHAGYIPMYLDDFTKECIYAERQIKFPDED